MGKYNRQNWKKYISCLLLAALTAGTLRYGVSLSMVAKATTIGEIQTSINQQEQALAAVLEQIEGLEDQHNLLEEEIADLNSEIINTMASIGVLEEQIAEKEEQIAEKGNEIVDKQVQIAATEEEYNAAVKREETHRQDMVDCTRMVYENRDDSYLTAILEGKGLSDILNQMDYIERVQEYSMKKLQDYMEAKEQVHALWDRLEEEKAELEAQRDSLEAARLSLQEDEEQLQDLKNDLNVKLARKKQESANYETEIARAQQEAAVAKRQIQKDREKLKQLQAAQAAQNAAGRPIVPTNYTAIIDGASGSDQGKKIAKYACQFVGNPYVYGGTSLTNGTDCSGFTYRVYCDWGYSLPRTSHQQRSAGTGVTYEEAQPGDLICYEGHVGMYIGSDLIVHASTEKTGIIVSRAKYKPILAVRRIVK